MRHSVISHTRKEVWRYNQVGANNLRSYTMDEGNGTTNFGSVKSGTIMGLLASGKIRPGGLADVASDYGPGLVVPVDDADNFYAGDVVSIYAGKSTKRQDTADVAAGDNPSDLTITAVAYGDSRIRYAQTKHTYNVCGDHDGTAIYHTLDDDGTNVDVNLYLAMAQDQHEIDVADDLGGNTQGVIFTARRAGDTRTRVQLSYTVYDRDQDYPLSYTRDDDGTNDDVVVWLPMAKDSHHWVVCNDGGGNTAEMIATATAGGNSRIKTKVTDPSANSQPLKITITDDGTDVLLDVSVATNGGGTITSTLQHVMDILEGTGLVLCALGTVAGTGSAAQVVIAVAATAIDGTTSGATTSTTTCEMLKDFVNGHPELGFTAADGTAAGTGSMADICIAVAATDIGTTTTGLTVVSTVQNINDYINGELAWLIAASDIAVAADLGNTLAATALAGGYDEGDAIASTRTVASVNKTTNAITIGGANVTVLDGDHVVLDDGWVPVGILEDQVQTNELAADGSITAYEQHVSVAIEGHAKSSLLIGNSALYTELMAGGYVPTELDSDGYMISNFARMFLRS
ncbi:MAG: hypothetical protein ABIL09_11060 [Gemmatimonadota bacterium]